eukprot:757117-Hanusia_phi.AAC.1
MISLEIESCQGEAGSGTAGPVTGHRVHGSFNRVRRSGMMASKETVMYWGLLSPNYRRPGCPGPGPVRRPQCP